MNNMYLNPFVAFTGERELYKRDFSVWIKASLLFLVGSRPYYFDSIFGLLDYLLVLPALTKWLYFNQRLQPFAEPILFIITLFDLIFYFVKNMVALLFIVTIPFIYIGYQFACYRLSSWEKAIFEAEMLMVEQSGENIVVREINDMRTPNIHRMVMTRETIFNIYYKDEGNSESALNKKIKFKNHPRVEDLKSNNLDLFYIEPIVIVDKNLPSTTILGLFAFSTTSGWCRLHDRNIKPIGLIVPSKKNHASIMAMKKCNAFRFSVHEEELMACLTEKDCIDISESYRRQTHFAITQALESAIPSGAADFSLKTSIDPLITQITQMAGMGALTPDDNAFEKRWRDHPLFLRQSFIEHPRFNDASPSELSSGKKTFV